MKQGMNDIAAIEKLLDDPRMTGKKIGEIRDRLRRLEGVLPEKKTAALSEGNVTEMYAKFERGGDLSRDDADALFQTAIRLYQLLHEQKRGRGADE